MRKIIYGINLSADGCCDHTQFGGGDEIHDYFTALLQEADLIIYGRKTFELMVPFWPEVAKTQSETPSVNQFAKTFSAIDKIVCSRSLTHMEGSKRVIGKNLEEEILELKAQPGKNISIGGISLPAELIKLGLVDEFYFLVHPVMSGQGRRLLDGVSLKEQLQLKLADTKTLASGCIALHYVK